VPVVLGNETCKVAQANQSSYACVSKNSTCIDSSNGPGYFCNCSNGYEGNSYLLDGYQDQLFSLKYSLFFSFLYIVSCC
jgi:hypothetical protein